MMKRKFFATMMTLALCVATLVGCGNNAPATTERETTAATNTIVQDDVLEADTKEADQTPSVAVEPTAEPQIPTTSAGDDDNLDPMSEEEAIPLEEETEEETIMPETGEIEGIIVLQADYRSDIAAPSFIVSVVDPQTGDYHEVSSFVFEHVARIRENEFLIDPAYEMGCYFNHRDLFNDDFTLMAATKTFLGNEEKHAGWVDQSGNFFDVTVALNEQAQNDFDTAKHYKAVGFTPDGNFAYADVEDPRHLIYYMVPLSNVSPGASYQVDGNDPYIMEEFADTWRWRRGYYQTCWINDDQFLAVNYANQGMVCARVTVSDQSMVDIVPSGSQVSWSPVIGPDGSSVAFMAAPPEGTDNPAIYITDIDGSSTPTKVETSYSMLCGRMAGHGSILFTISLGYHYASVLEWR